MHLSIVAEIATYEFGHPQVSKITGSLMPVRKGLAADAVIIYYAWLWGPCGDRHDFFVTRYFDLSLL